MRHHEHEHQRAFFTWARWNKNAEPRLRYLFAIPNGTPTTARAGARAKSEGVMAGVPDVMLAVPVAPHAGLFLEMKIHSGRPSAQQVLWQKALADQGYAVAVVYGWEAAKNASLRYLRGEWNTQDVEVIR